MRGWGDAEVEWVNGGDASRHARTQHRAERIVEQEKRVLITFN